MHGRHAFVDEDAKLQKSMQIETEVLLQLRSACMEASEFIVRVQSVTPFVLLSLCLRFSPNSLSIRIICTNEWDYY